MSYAVKTMIALALLFCGTGTVMAQQTYPLLTYRACHTVQAVKDVFAQKSEEQATAVFEAYMEAEICAHAPFPVKALVNQVLENVTWVEGESAVVGFDIEVNGVQQPAYWLVNRELADKIRTYLKGV
ncbi:MAG: hypothetical protein V3S01_11260 [Dehalococcoidia bacterium]